jgi:hypothetical protein
VQVIARHVTSLNARPAVISMQAFRDYPQHKPGWAVQDWVRPIVEPCGVHMVSYRDAVWPVFEQHNGSVSSIFWESYDGIHITSRSAHACPWCSIHHAAISDKHYLKLIMCVLSIHGTDLHNFTLMYLYIFWRDHM